MIIHSQEDFSNYKLCLCKSLKYSDTFTFIPIKIYKNKYSECIIQTPLLFTPFGIQKTQNNKDIIDLSFQNKENDDSLKNFLKILKIIYQCIFKKYKSKYTVNPFIKETDFNECIRLKISLNTQYFDELKNRIHTIDKFSYGISDRGASIRIPINVANDRWKGYLEDRRPSSNACPYTIVKLITNNVRILEPKLD